MPRIFKESGPCCGFLQPAAEMVHRAGQAVIFPTSCKKALVAVVMALVAYHTAASVFKTTPQQAALLMKQGYVYLDVRTPEEFAAERVPGSVNIPFMFSSPSGRVPNPNFMKQVQTKFPNPNTALVLVGCATGRRSAVAAAALGQVYPKVADNTGGIEGWAAAKLPVTK